MIIRRLRSLIADSGVTSDGSVASCDSPDAAGGVVGVSCVVAFSLSTIADGGGVDNGGGVVNGSGVADGKGVAGGGGGGTEIKVR